VRGELRDLAGSNRFLPVADPTGPGRWEVATRRFILEVRWTFWD
jgi:hypothetical protein